MDKIEIIKKLGEEKLVAVIRAESKEMGVKISKSVIAGGIKFIEIAFTIPKAEKVIEELVENTTDPKVIIGAGTVLDVETARLAILAGAQFVVSPAFDEQLVKLANRYRVPVITGALSPAEIIKAMEHGIDVIKLFPGEVYGPKIIKSLKGPLPQGLYMPTGGVNLENVKDWLACGAYAVGTGGGLTAGAKTGDFTAITKEAEKFVKAVHGEQ